ncbi:MAG: hypothetical protein XD63_1311 [Thermoanaerobacterales bacterium 50_218]|nr:MAG: hypothetical protein XD63_1311 [Thermoanaerobacterales bacterium 50_218]
MVRIVENVSVRVFTDDNLFKGEGFDEMRIPD